MKETDPSVRRNCLRLKSALAAGAVLGILILAAGGWWYSRLAEQEHRQKEISREIDRVRSDTDPAALQRLRDLTAAAGLQGPLGELEYQILHRRWLEMLRRFDSLLAAGGNRYLRANLQAGVEETRKGLLDLRESCSSLLDSRAENAAAPVAWKIYNLRGCLSVMAAYLSLKFDEDGRKSGKFLNDAIEDFKTALDQAEKAGAPLYERTLPGWNLRADRRLGRIHDRRAGNHGGKPGGGAGTARSPPCPVSGATPPARPLETKVRK